MMDLLKLYNNLNIIINKVDFSNLWDGFYCLKYAIYNDKEVCFDGEIIPKTDEFIANTSILYQGEYIAIFSVDEDEDVEILSSKIIHEMFHAFQSINNEQRFPNEIDAIINYKYDKENLSAKFLENQLIASLCSCFDMNKYNEFLSIRKTRADKFNYEFIYESKIEQIEGTANFVELYALKSINQEKYIEKKQQMINDICNVDNLFPIRVISYDIGALLIDVIKNNNLKCRFDFTNVTYSEHLIENISNTTLVILNNEIEKTIDKQHNELKEVIINSINEIPQKNGNFKLLGLNVYNAVSYRISNSIYITSTYFLMFQENDCEQIIYGDYVIEFLDGYIKKIYKMVKR